ncbi:MAG: glycosyltransferase family 9 protein [Desulfobacterales bacterium]|jgi:ADP-heptose:LPS heptosyltransferase
MMPENRLLIIHQGALGDFVVTFPILKALRTTIPRIDGICRSSFGRLAVDLGVLDASYPLESARFASLYTDRIDPEVATPMSTYRSILLFSFSELLERSVKKINGPQVIRILPWPAVSQKNHITEFLARQVRNNLLGKEDRRRFSRALFHLKGDASRKRRSGARVIISPGAGSVKKRWPLERYLMVAAELKRRGLQPSILLGPAEVDLEAVLQHSLQSQPQVVKTRTFQELITVLETAAIYIGNDSGVSHLAAFLSVPTLVIFGPSDPDRWRPFGDHVRIVKAASPCSPCFDTDRPACPEHACLEEINPDRIVEALEGMLDKERKARK